MREPVGEIAVVREQQDAARVDVQPADRHDARLVADEVDDGRATLGIAGSCHDAERLVEENVRKLLLADPLAVDLDDVPRCDEGVELAALPVDRYPALLDQLVRGATRRDAGAGEIAIEAHEVDCRLLSGAVRDYTDLTRRLADLIVGYGANVQPGQLVGVTSYVGKEELTREIARAAYERGAHYVDVHYWDQWVKRQRLLHGDPETFGYIPPWIHDRMRHFSDEHAARISLSGPQAPTPWTAFPADRSGIDSLPYLPEIGRDHQSPHDELVRGAGADEGVG